MILRGSKTNLDLRKPHKNGFILENITQQMTRTHWEVRMADDGLDGNGNGLQNGFLKTGQDERFSDIHVWFLNL